MKTAEEIEAWANAYIDCGGIALASEDRPLWWAVEDFMNMSHGKLWTPEECWKTILLILTKAPSANVTSVLAAGPLEDLIRNCGDQFIDRIEIESRRNPAFRNLLGGVWKVVRKKCGSVCKSRKGPPGEIGSDKSPSGTSLALHCKLVTQARPMRLSCG